MTGSDLQEHSNIEILELWQQCHATTEIHFYIFGERYLRLDREVDGYARLSPSIRREFQTYTVVGLQSQQKACKELTLSLRQHIEKISQEKLALARQVMADIMARKDNELLDKCCAIIAGDVVYNMAHTVPRPESSTGTMVKGSDLDIIIVTADSLPPHYATELDADIYNKKHFMLVHPDYREEIDYVIKPLSRIQEQSAFDTFEHMVACKILDEGQLLFGSPFLFDEIKEQITQAGVPDKISTMKARASRFRADAEQALRYTDNPQHNRDMLHLFFTKEESDEIF